MRKWSVKKAEDWYKSKPWILGCNYLPTSAVNSTDMWQHLTWDRAGIETGLKLASATGMNSVRVFLPYIVWADDAQGFYTRLSEFLKIASDNGISTLPVLFDDCAFSGKEPYLGLQEPPVEGVHNSQWTPSPGFKLADDTASIVRLQRYVQETISTFSNDERILAWDLYNEPGNSNRGDESLALVKHSFQWAREINPNQPLTTAIWNWSSPCAGEKWAMEQSDIISFHCYQSVETTEQHIKELEQYGRPVLCTEWLHRPAGSSVETHFPLFLQHRVGIFNWGLIVGRTQTHCHWATMTGEPDSNPIPWQHDLYNPDETPYSRAEIEVFIRSQ